PNPLATALAAAGRAASAALAREEAGLEVEEREVRQLAGELDASIERLQAGEHETPPIPHTRDPSAREERAGAPLWLLVDFRSGVPEQRRAGIEAALEASGILDAWVSPDGELLAPGTQDVLLTPDERDPVGGARLHDVLEPAIDREDRCAGQVQVEAVRRVLAAVALAQDDGTVWVTPEGEFRNGVLRGSWRKPAAAFIGRGAREVARRARLAELRERREQAQRRLGELTGACQRLGERRAQLEDQLQGMPPDEALRDAHGALTGLDTERARLAERIAATAARLAQAEAERAQAERTARESAEELGLPYEDTQLDVMRAGLQAFRVTLAALWPACLALDHARGAVTEAGRDVETAARELVDHSERLQAAGREAAERKERHETLAQTVGAAVAELQRRLADVASALRENERGRREADARRSQAQREEGREDGRRQQLAVELEQATERRRADVDTLRRFAGTGLIGVALGEVELPEGEEEWGVTAALRLARQIDQALADAAEDEPAWQRAQRR
ncbi:MAG: TIGR02680 family protein, partial [Solirubrobacterales bacterium]